MKKRDVMIILVVLLVALVPMAISKFSNSIPEDADYVVIYLGSEEYKRIPLSEPQIVVIDQDGLHNEVKITSNGVVMHDANCDNQDCIQQGEVTLENIEYRAMEGWIVCLPNRVSVELVKGAAK